MIREQLRRLGTQSAIYGLSSVLGASATLILVPLLTRHLSTSQYGTLEVLSVFATQLGVLLQLGLGSALFRFVVGPGQNTQDTRLVISTAYWVIAAFSLGAVALLLPLSALLAGLLTGQPEHAVLVKWILAKVLFEAISVVPMARLRIREASITYGALSGSRLFVTLGYVIIGLTVLSDPLLAVVIASAAEAFTFALITTGTAFKDLMFEVSGAAARGMLKFGVPLIPYTFGLTVLSVGDRYLLRHFGGLAEVGPYAVGYKLAAVLAIPVRAFQVAWPTFLFASAGNPSGKNFYARVLLYLLLVLGFGGVGVGVFAREIVAIAAGPAFAQGYRVVPVLIVAQISYGVFLATAVGTNLTGKTHLVTVSAVMALGVFGVAAILLIPGYGMVGAAGATALGYITMAAADCFFSVRLYPVPYQWKRITGIAALTILLMGLGARIDSGSRAMDLVLKLGLIAAYPIVLLLSGFFSPAERLAFRELIQRMKARPVGPSTEVLPPVTGHDRGTIS